MTLSQGVFEMKLPDGFGFPVASTEPLYLYTQVLNLNIDDPKNMKVRHRVTFTYVRDAARKQPMVALFNAGASGLVRLDDNLAMPAMAMAPMTDDKGIEHHSAADCLVGMRAPNANGMSSDYTDPGVASSPATGSCRPASRRTTATSPGSCSCRTTRRSTTPPCTSTRSRSR